MTSERIQRRVERLLDQAEAAADEKRWPDVEALAREALTLRDSDPDAMALLERGSPPEEDPQKEKRARNYGATTSVQRVD